MCGINGFTFPDESLIRRMNAVTAHRGPDGSAAYTGKGISLGHNRLAITDTGDAAVQPLWSAGRRHAIVFNGEVYNYAALRADLPDYRFESGSDTEVVLAAYERWGPRCVEVFDGIFSFAIWSPVREELFFARDAYGVKPFYYRNEGGRFFFSSEIKGFLPHGRRGLFLPAFASYMRCGYVARDESLLDGIVKLPPAHRGFFRAGILRTERYGKPAASLPEYGNRRIAEDAVRAALQSSVAAQCVGKRPFGLYLSGGIDSGIVLDCAARAGRLPIRAFSSSFELDGSEEPEKFNADALLARNLAAAYGVPHEEVAVAANEAPQLFEKAMFHLDEPVGNPTAVAMMAVSRAAAREARIMLSGDGGDELFGGYKRYRLSRRMRLAGLLPPFLLPRRLRNAADPLDRIGLFMWEKDARLRSVLHDGSVTGDHRPFFGAALAEARAAFSNADFESLFMEVDRRTWLVGESLLRTDKTAMAYGIEARVPFLSPAVVEAARRTPRNYKVGLFCTKRILREAFRGRLPDYVLSQPKRGWMAPGAKWLRRPAVRAYAESVLSPSYCSTTADLFKWDGVRRMLARHIAREEYSSAMIWKIMAFQVWARVFL